MCVCTILVTCDLPGLMGSYTSHSLCSLSLKYNNANNTDTLLLLHAPLLVEEGCKL